MKDVQHLKDYKNLSCTVVSQLYSIFLSTTTDFTCTLNFLRAAT